MELARHVLNIFSKSHIYVCMYIVMGGQIFEYKYEIPKYGYDIV